MGIFSLNRKLLPLKANYFLLDAAVVGVLPLLPVYAKNIGIQVDVVGYIFAFIKFIMVLSQPLIGALVDRIQKLKVVLIILVLIDIVAVIGIDFIPQLPQKPIDYTNASLICLQNNSYVLDYDLKECGPRNKSSCFDPCISSCLKCQVKSSVCSTTFKENSTYDKETAVVHIPLNCIDSFLDKCDSDRNTSCNEECIGAYHFNCGEESKGSTTLQILLFTTIMAIMSIGIASHYFLSDAACFNLLENKPELFGRQVMFGKIGWGVFGLVSGYLNQMVTGNSKSYSYSAGFYLMAILLLIDIIVLMKLDVKEVKVSKNIFKDVALLAWNPRIIVFIVQVFFIGILIGMSRTYLYWYLRNLNANQLVLGLHSGIQCFLGVVPFFFFSGWIIKKIGHVNTFTMSFAAHGVKFLSYSFLFNPWWSLPIEIVQGPCFGTFYAAMASYAKIIAPTGTEATVQGVARAIFDGLGLAAGSLLGGYGFRVLGGRTTFFWTGIISFILAMASSIANAILIWKYPTS